MERRREGKSLAAIPDECAGLIDAMREAERGDHRPLEKWMREARPCLVAALEGAGYSVDSAEDAVCEMLAKALSVARDGLELRNEHGWMSVLLSHAAINAWRRRQREVSLEQARFREVASVGCFVDTPTILDQAISRLPIPFRQICTAQYVRGGSRADTIRYLLRWRPNVSRQTGRWLLREAHQMLRAAIAGEDIRRRWPARFSRNSRWKSTPPPGFERHFCGRATPHRE